MKIIISENKLVYLINDTLGYDLSRTIEMITNYWDTNILVRRMFRSKDRFNELLNHWGPMYWISTPENGKWLVQQREGGEWFISKSGRTPEYAERIDEYEMLSYMGINMFGIPLEMIINNFVKEE
jgi:hypothetical protein